MEPQRHFVNENIFCAPVKALLIEKLKALSCYLNYLYLGKKRRRLSIFSKTLLYYHDVTIVLYLSPQKSWRAETFFSFSSKLIGHLDTYQACLGGEKQPGIRGNRRVLTRILLVRDGDASMRWPAMAQIAENGEGEDQRNLLWANCSSG